MKILICDKCRKEDKGILMVKQITLIGLAIRDRYSPTYELCYECQEILVQKIKEFLPSFPHEKEN
ncbi:MAG: hypothetical protein AABY22_07270 [Nanoarchaeota archaeon]